jgi:hypothetical protein
MGNSMRRKEKEIKDPEVIQKIFKEADICRIHYQMVKNLT